MTVLRESERVEPMAAPDGNARPFERAQRNANASARRLNNSPVGAGRTIGPVGFAAGQTKALMHNLPLPKGATPRGWIVVDATGNPGLFHRTAWDERTITLTSTNNCNCTFWVFA